MSIHKKEFYIGIGFILTPFIILVLGTIQKEIPTLEFFIVSILFVGVGIIFIFIVLTKNYQNESKNVSRSIVEV